MKHELTIYYFICIICLNFILFQTKMSLHRNKKEILATVEQSHYLPILGSLLIGFIIAWSVRQPGFHEQPTYDSHGAATLLARDLPVREADTLGEENKKPAHDFGEFQPLVAEKPEIKTIEWNSALPRPELFVKTTPTDGGHLISFSTNNFTIGNNGYLVLSNDV